MRRCLAISSPLLASLAPGPEIGFDVEVRVAILLVQPPALLPDLVDFCNALGGRLVEAVQGVAAFGGAGRGWVGIISAEAVPIDVIGENGVRFARMRVGEVPPEVCDRLLGVVVAGQSAMAVDGCGGCEDAGLGRRAVIGCRRGGAMVWEGH